MEMDIFDSLNMIGSGDQDSLTGFVDSVQEFTSPKATEEDQIYNVIGIDKLFESATTDIDDSYDFSDIQDIKDFSVNPNYMQLQEEIHFPEDNGIQSSGSYQVEHSGSLTNSNRNNISQQISYSVCNSQVKQATPIQSAHSHHFKDKSQMEIEIIDSVKSSKASSFTQVKRDILEVSTMPLSRVRKRAKMVQPNKNSYIPSISQKDFKAITGKNPKSGYLIFCSDIRKTIADKNPGVSFSDIGKAMGVEWNKLTEKQKQEYQERAKVINLQKLNESRGKTEEEENVFGSPSSPPDEPEIVFTKYSSNSKHPFNSKQTLGSASAIAISSTSTVDCAKAPISGSKAPSGFDFYCNEMRKKVSERHPKANYEDAEALLRLLKSEWNNLSEKDRLHFEQKVQQCRTVPNPAPIGASCKAINYRSGSRNGPGFRNFKALTGQNQKTGYLMFCSEVRKAITDKNPGVSFSDLGKAMGVEWNKLTEKQKQGYQERAKEINLQILKETQDRPKDEPPPVCNSISKSKPSKSGFSVFATEYRKEMKKRFPNYNRREISQLVSNEWKKLGADEKLRYVHQAAAVNLVVESEKVSSTVLPNESVKMDFNVSSQSLNSDHSNSNLYPFSTPLCNSEVKKGKKKSPTINETFSRKGRSNGYQLYCVERHKRVKEEMPDATFGEICRFVGNEWKGLPASIRKEYQEKANMINLETQAKKEQKPEIIALDRERNLAVNHQPVPVPTIQPSNVAKSVSWSNPANQIPPPEISICTSNQSVYRSIVPSPIVSSPQWIQKKPVMQTQLPIPNTQMIYFIPQKWNQVHTVKHVAMPPRLEPIVPNVSIIHQQPPTIITEVVPKEEVISKEKLMSYKIYNPLSAYQFFFVEMQRRVTGKYPAISFDKASQLIDTQWYHLNHEERKVLHDRVEQIKNEIEKAKLFYARDCDTPDSVSQTGSEADSLGNPDSPAVIKNEPESFLDEFDSLEDYFDQLQSPENMRDVQPSDTEMKFETPESINNSVPKDTSQLSRELNLSSCLETPKTIKNECDSVDVFDMTDTSINSSQHDLTEHFSNSDLPVNFENFKAAIEGRNGSILAASDQLYGNPQKKKKSSLPKSCPQFAYEIFFKEMEKSLRAKNPSATYDEISKLIDIQWNRLKKSDKKVLKTQARRSLKLAKEQGSLPVDPSSVVINCDKHTQETIKIESQNFKPTDSPHLQALLTSPVKTEIFDAKFDRVEGKMPLVKKLLSAEKFDTTKPYLKCNPKSLNGKKTAISSPKCKKSAMRSPTDNKSEMKSKKFRRFDPTAENESSVKLEFGPLRSPKHSNESVGNDSFLSTDYQFDFKPKADLLYETLMNFEEDGRKPITLFIQLPSKEKWPDYYKAVKHPMDMKTFDAKLNSGRYKNIKGVIRDLRLMFRNCLEYHKKGSQIYKDAIMLKQILNKAIRDCKPELQLPNHIEDLEECEDASNYYNLRKIKSFFGLVKNLKEKNKALSRFFWKPMDTELNPKYYEIIKEPMDFDIITQRISDSSYVSLSDIYTDFKKLFQNTYQYYEPESQTYRAALSLHKFASQKFSELNQQVDRIPHISNSVQDLLLSIFASTFNHKNSNGKHLSDSVSRLPSFDWIDGVWTRVETLESIMMRLNKGLYCRLDELQNDLFSVFERARRYQDVYDEIYEDSVKLQRKYIAVRDQFCAHGIILKSQALNFKIKDFTAELQLHKREQTLDCDDDQMQVSSCGDINSSFKNASGDPFCVGDYIYVNPLQSESISDCLIMEITKLWTSSMGEEMVYGTQYFKPQDINMWLGNIPEETSVDENIISREMVLDYLSLKFHDHELIKSEKCLSLSFSKVVGKCVILSPLNYCKLLIENFHPQDIYSCQYLYSFSSHKFENLESVPLNSLRFPNYITTSERVEPLQVGLGRSFFELKAERRVKEMVELLKYIEKARLSPVMRDIVKKEEMIEDETYYIQYRSPIGHLKIGDFVYMKSGETYRKFILHIHRILVATSGEETLIGNRYIIQDKILDDKSGALFSFKEAYYLVNRETHPLCNVVGRCLILNFKDYLKTRPTQIAEEDVYLCEFSFDEECQCLRPQDFAITKYKLPSEVYQDEMYSWPKMISPKEFQRNHIIDGEHFDIVYPIGDGSFSRSNILDPTFQYKVPAPVQGSKPKFKFNNYYFFFQNERFKELRKEYPDKCPSEIYSMTAQEWKGLSEEVKMDYQRRMKERAALYEQQSCDTSVEEFDEQDGRKSYRLVRSKGFDQKKETGYRRIYSLQTEEVNVCQKTLFNWLQQQKALRKVVTCREFKEKAFSFYKSVGLNPPHIRHLHNFKQIYRNEIHDEQLIRDGRGRPPLEAEKLKKRRRILKQAKEVKLSIQREADLDLLEEFDIPDCRVVVKLVEPCELSSKDRLYLQKRCHQMYRKLSSLNSFTKVKTPKRPKCMRKLESVSKICNCNICNIELPNKLSLDKHMQSEHKDVCTVSNNICSLCGKSFPRNVDLTCHKRWHLMMQKHWYYCKVCDKFFKKDKLKEHMQQHLKEDVKLVLNEHQQLEVVDPEEKVEVNSLNESQLENLSCDSYLNTLQDNLNDSILENFDALTDHLDAELLSSSSPLNIGSDDEIFHSSNTESKIESNDVTVKSDSGALKSSSVKSDSRNNDSDTIALKSDSISTNNETVSMEVDIIDKTDSMDALSGAVSVVSDNNHTLVEYEIINASSNDIDAKCSLNEIEPFANLNGLNSADMEIDNNETLIVTSPTKFDISRHIESQNTYAASTSFAVEGRNKSDIPNEIKAPSIEANISAKTINSTACAALESSLKCKDTLCIEKKATDVMLIVDQCLKKSGSVSQNSDALIEESTNFVTISSEIVEGKLGKAVKTTSVNKNLSRFLAGENLEKIASTTDIEHNKNIALPQSNCIDADQGSQMSFCEGNVPANQPVEI